jgi:ParB family chromosome partitioning protein
MRRNSKKKYTTEAIGVEEIRTKELSPNPHNPRMLFDKEPMDILRESIRKVGILVPLTVYRSESQKKYFILDGQRRWMCAQDLRLPKVPVNIVREPSLVQNIVTMFQIHKLREDWQLMPTALKLELLMRELREKNERKLATLTSLDVAVVRRCKKLLTYPKKYQDMMLDPDPAKRVKADFFIELYPVITDRVVKSMNWFRRNALTARMLHKYQSKDSPLKAVTDFRKIKQHITSAKKANRIQTITKRFKEFAEDDMVPISHLEIRSASLHAHSIALVGNINKLIDDIENIDVGQYYAEDELWESLKELSELIKRKLTEAERR